MFLELELQLKIKLKIKKKIDLGILLSMVFIGYAPQTYAATKPISLYTTKLVKDDKLAGTSTLPL